MHKHHSLTANMYIAAYSVTITAKLVCT